MSMWRSALTKTRSHLVPRFAISIPGRCYAKDGKRDHNPSPKCSDQATGGKACGKFQPCGDPRFESKKSAEDENSFQFNHLIKQPPFCCEDPCMDRYPKFDDCFYEISDKAKRKYQITWVECPPIQIKPKKICCFKNAKHPPIPRRKRKDFVAGVECPKEDKCLSVAEGPCPRIRLPGCKAVESTSCHVVRRKTDCKKVNAPYPAFSECARDSIRPPRRVECNCLDIPAQCDVLAEIMRTESNPGKKNCGGSRG